MLIRTESTCNKMMIILLPGGQVRQVQLKEQVEKSRVLQESLHALAAEHHDLERSLQRQPSIRSLHDQDDFYDCDDDSYGEAALWLTQLDDDDDDR